MSIHNTHFHLLTLAFCMILLPGCSPEVKEPVYSIKSYDPTSNPANDLASTVQQAQAEGKRILLQVGGDWCGWCHRLDKFIAVNPAIGAALHDNFIIMKVHYSSKNRNEQFLDQYPEIKGYPHLYVLDSDGTLLHSQRTAHLEEGSSYSEQAILEFLETWKS